MVGWTDEALKRTFGCALATRSKISRVSALKLRSGYWTEIMNSLNRFGAELTAYVQEVVFLIDNNEAERVVRSMPTARNNSFHFGSDLNAQMSATYHSIISTVKLHGSSVLSYLGKFFTKIFEGCRDYSSLLPSCIGLA